MSDARGGVGRTGAVGRGSPKSQNENTKAKRAAKGVERDPKGDGQI